MGQRNCFFSVTAVLCLSSSTLMIWNWHSLKTSKVKVESLHHYNTTFFIETGNGTHLSPRQSCAVEAAATLHKGFPVLVYMKNVNFDEVQKKNRWIEQFSNIHIVPLDLDQLFAGTPAYKIYDSPGFKTGQFATEHSSDMARLVLLKKFGGLYLDLDMVLFKPMLGLRPFFLRELGNPIIRCEKDNLLISKTYDKLGEIDYNPRSWLGVGSEIITAAATELCKLKLEENNYEEASVKCNVSFLDPGLVAPIQWYEWQNFFDNDEDLQSFRAEAFQEAYALHVANFMTKTIIVSRNSSGLYNQLAKKHCPLAYRTFPDKF